MKNETRKLSDLAKTIRSKNAGTDKITFDIIFREKETYELVKRAKGADPRTCQRGTRNRSFENYRFRDV